MKRLFTSILVLGLFSHAFSQSKVTISPEPDQVTLEGRLAKSPVKISAKVPTQFVVAAKKGYVTYGKKSDELMEAGITSVQLDEISKLEEGVETRKIEFSKIADGSSKLSSGGYVGWGAWGGYSAPTNFEDPKFSKAINKAMEKWGYNMVGTNAMFEERGDSPDLVVACEVVGFGKDTRGSGFQVSVLLNWSVYSVDKKKVVYELQTGGYSDSKKGLKFIDELVFAVSDGLVGLMSASKFQELAVKSSELSSDGAAVEATNLPKVESQDYAGYGDMIKGVVGSVVTVKTNFGHGSGFVISKSGVLLTNNHVVSGASEIEVIFDNGFKMEGTLIKANEERDVAMVKIAGSGFKPLQVNVDESASDVGTEVIAIGTPTDLKLGQTVTKGIVSAKRELEDEDERKNNYIQTDVSINRGNSGGPLLNNKGEVVGVIVSKMMGKDIEGLGFAVPIAEALDKLNINFE